MVFSRSSLHAKLIVADNLVIAGSANVSKNSQDNLDEPGIVTTDPYVIRHALTFFDLLYTEPQDS
jgi:phosphatidylserine/phosphatidylglycerophosphate/cardiolipin synthase-like enzyme